MNDRMTKAFKEIEQLDKHKYSMKVYLDNAYEKIWILKLACGSLFGLVLGVIGLAFTRGVEANIYIAMFVSFVLLVFIVMFTKWFFSPQESFDTIVHEIEVAKAKARESEQKAAMEAYYRNKSNLAPATS